MLIAVLSGLVALLFLLSLATGPVLLDPLASLGALAGFGPETERLIVAEIRLPRTLLAAATGATLGLAGATIQGYVRNPLASPSLIGTSQAAALGAVMALATGMVGALSVVVPLAAIAMAFIAALVLISVTGRDQKTITLILAGLALSSLFAALTSLVLNLSANPFATLEITFWLLGSLADRSLQHVWLSLPFMALSWVVLASQSAAVKGLSLGEDVARTLGVNLARLRFAVIGGIALGVGAAVAVSGVVGFVGLVVPHMVRPFVDYDPGRLALPSALAGAALVLAADTATKLVPTSGQELKLGVFTALIGVPFFLYLVLRQRRAGAF